MKKIQSTQLFYLLLLSWFLINIVQSILTEITNDEAYYALWGSRLDWGYFDHPPMVAVFTAISSWLFSGNLGVRFMTVAMQLATLMLVWKTLGLKTTTNSLIVRFFALAASIVMFTAYGFITTPDVPLLFFAALFLRSYRLFLAKESLFNGLLLAVAMAGMIYSKYQAGLLIVLVVLSNLKLLLNYRFWLAGILALVLLIPHAVWQIQHDFPGFQYHLVDRSSAFTWKFFFEYWPNQLAVFNPFTLVAVGWALFSKRKIAVFDRALYFIIVGFLVFFWGTSFRGHVEPHWTIAASLPMLILVMRESELNPKLVRYIRRFVYPSLLLILIARVLIMTDVLPKRLAFHGKEQRYNALHEVAGESPVIFRGSFQNPSLYQYFTGKDAQVISSLYSRRTQFDIWKAEEQLYDKMVFVTGQYEGRSEIFGSYEHKFEGFFTDSLQVTNHIKISYQLPEGDLIAGDTVVIPVVLQNNSVQHYEFHHPVFPGKLIGIFISKGKMTEIEAVWNTEEKLLPGEEVATTISLQVPESGDAACQFTLSLKSWFGPTLNAAITNIIILQP
ncbi:MAG: glycosyltransferase family 39 protein [Paludibacter sp.]|nr:glycosyltransferase family 39 protein [Paludibacter sp.]